MKGVIGQYRSAVARRIAVVALCSWVMLLGGVMLSRHAGAGAMPETVAQVALCLMVIGFAAGVMVHRGRTYAQQIRILRAHLFLPPLDLALFAPRGAREPWRRHADRVLGVAAGLALWAAAGCVLHATHQMLAGAAFRPEAAGWPTLGFLTVGTLGIGIAVAAALAGGGLMRRGWLEEVRQRPVLVVC